MFTRKFSRSTLFDAAIGSGLVISVTFVVAILVEAVAGMHSYL